MAMDKSKKRNLLVVNIRPEYYSILNKYRIPFPVQDDSWSGDSISKDGLYRMLVKYQFLNEVHYDVSFFLPVVRDDHDSLSLFFNVFSREVQLYLYQKMDGLTVGDILVFNFMSYDLCASLIDKIFSGLFMNVDYASEYGIVFMVKNYRSLIKSKVFLDLVKRQWFGCGFLVFDFFGNYMRFKDGVISEGFEPDRKYYYDLMGVSKDKIYGSLIYKTNSYIGHYDLGGAHIRTHYDLTHFVTKDNVTEYLYGILSDIKGDAECVLVVGIGLERKAIDIVGVHFQSTLKDLIGVEFRYFNDYNVFDEFLSEWKCRYDLIIVVGDIVNSGGTLRPYIARLKEYAGKFVGLKVFAMVRMLNSVKSIEGVWLDYAIEIKRKSYLKDIDVCPLCHLLQPVTSVSTIEDFNDVSDKQLTPFDFWEIVTDSKALKGGEFDKQERYFYYRVDVAMIVKKYKNWIYNLIRCKYEKIWTNTRPDFILTISEAYYDGIDSPCFVSLVSKAVKVNDIIKVPRKNIKKITENIRNEFDKYLCSGAPVKTLIVDNSISHGNTVRGLLNVCQELKIMPVGVLVFDSRLNSTAEQNIRNRVEDKYVALYSWPSTMTHL